MGYPPSILTLILSTLAAVSPSNAAGGCVGNNKSVDGSSLYAPVTLDLKPGAAIDLNLSTGRECYLGIDVDVPSAVSLTLENYSTGDADRPVTFRLLRRIFSTDAPLVIKEGRFALSTDVSFDEIPADGYILELRTPPAPIARTDRAAGKGGTYQLKTVSVKELAIPELTARSGAELHFRLERQSGSAFATINLPERAELTLQLDTSQWPGAEEQRKKVGIHLTDLRGRNYAAYLKTRGTAGLEIYRYVVDRGPYRLRIRQEQNSWPRTPLDDAQSAATLPLQVSGIQPSPVPGALAALDEWLSRVGLNEAIQVVHSYDRTKDADGLPQETRDEYAAILNSIGKSRAEAGSATWGKGLEPQLVVRLRTLVTRDALRNIERRIEAIDGVSVWDRALRKIRSATNVPTANIVIVMPVYCSGGRIYERRPGIAGRYGSECFSASAAVDWTQLLADRLDNTAANLKSRSEVDLSKAVEAFLPSFLSDKGAKIEYLNSSPAFVELIMRGIKGQVIKGGNDWERVQLSFIRVAKNEKDREIRIVADGQLASGAGGYPPDTQFTKDIEAYSGKALSDYVRGLASAFGKHLVGTGK